MRDKIPFNCRRGGGGTFLGRWSLRFLRSWLFITALLCVLCAGSYSQAAQVSEMQDSSVEELFNKAMSFLQEGEYYEAVKYFEETDRQHPYSMWARLSNVMISFAYYQMRLYEDAINSIDRFVSLHPEHTSVRYLLFLKGVCFYEQIVDVKRDQNVAKLAAKGFRDVILRYPGSPYAIRSQELLEKTYDHLTGKEMDVGRYYLQRDQHVAAINRFQRVYKMYPRTVIHRPEALYRLVEAFWALGIKSESWVAASVLEYEYPDSEWVKASQNLLDTDKKE